MRCLRIFGAYSLRLSRRHSTIMTIASLLVVLTLIFQLYAYRHHDHHNTSTNGGDFHYKPGSFLEHTQPNENTSYCQFNYGLPDKLQWGSFYVHTTPEMGLRSPYRIIYNAIKGTAYMNISRYDSVTYVTQATPEFLYHIVEIARYWEGPISVSVFVPDYDIDIAIQMLQQLCHCYSGMSKVSVHLFYPKKNPPRLAREPYVPPTQPPTVLNVSAADLLKIKVDNFQKLTDKNRAEYIQEVRKKKIQRMMSKMPTKRHLAPRLNFYDCSSPDEKQIHTYRREYNLIYPINVGRNSARNASKTNYFLVSDIEMLPSDGLASKFVAMVRRLMGDKKRDEGCVFAKTVFVVPLFEVEKGEQIPRDKDTLVEMVNTNRAMYFHERSCSHCQRFPGMPGWLKRPAPAGLEPMLMARREYPFHRWEPLYFGTHKEPWYSEMLSWEGQQDKMTQMLELCLQGYRMIVLDGGFLCHSAAVKSKNKHNKAELVNSRRYIKIIKELKQNYPERPQCRVNYGCS